MARFQAQPEEENTLTGMTKMVIYAYYLRLEGEHD